jgi:hypothetical protein
MSRSSPSPTADRLLRRIRAAADAREALPTTTGLAEQLGLSGAWAVTSLLRELERHARIVVRHGKRGILAIEAPDGSWRAAGSAAARSAAALPKRQCLRCRRAFTPEHRHNFLCGCQNWVARHGGVA